MKPLCRSSFEPSVRYLAGRNYVGNVCPEGHRLFGIPFKRTRWCDLCVQELAPGSRGEFCKACDSYDICVSCAETGGPQSQPLASSIVDSAPATKTQGAAQINAFVIPCIAVACAVGQVCEASPPTRNNASVIASTANIPDIAIASAVVPVACEAPPPRVNRMKLKAKRTRIEINDWMIPWMWLF